MAFRHMVRVGRRWLNPWFVVEIEDRMVPTLDPGGDTLMVTVVPGRSFAVSGDEATQLRRFLDQDGPGEPSGETIETSGPPPPGGAMPDQAEAPGVVETYSGVSDRPLVGAVERCPDETCQVSE